jgi:hypothetical protein
MYRQPLIRITGIPAKGTVKRIFTNAVPVTVSRQEQNESCNLLPWLPVNGKKAVQTVGLLNAKKYNPMNIFLKITVSEKILDAVNQLLIEKTGSPIEDLIKLDGEVINVDVENIIEEMGFTIDQLISIVSMFAKK